MADEVTFAGFKADAGLDEILNRLVHEDLVDRADLMLTAMQVGDLNGTGSDTIKTPAFQRNNVMVAAGENVAAVNQAVAKRSYTIAVARQTIAFEKSDFAGILGIAGVDLPRLVQMVVDAASFRRTDILAALFPSFTTAKGTSGAPLGLDDLYDSQFALTIALNSASGLVAALKPKQLTEIQDDMRNEGGAVQFVAATAEMLRAKGQGLAGSWNGYDLHSVDSVTDDATDFSGAMYGPGALAYATASAQEAAGSIPIPVGSSIFVEAERTAREALSAVIGHDYFGAAIQENARGVELNSGI
jgi:hypothetical protein